MNKFFRILTVTAIAAVAMTGCRKDAPDVTPDPSERVEVKFTTGILPASKLKVANDQFQTNDQIGVFMKQAGQALTVSGAAYPEGNNVLLDYQGASVLAPNPPVYYPLTGNVDFIAYYPRTASVASGYTVPVDVAVQTPALPVETLYSNNAGNKAPSPDPVALNFKYSLAKLEITVAGGENSKLTGADFDNMTVEIEGMYTKANLQLVDGTFAAHTAKQNITMRKKGNTATSANFEALALPRVPADGAITFLFHAGSATYQYKYSPEYATATLYQLNFALDFQYVPDPTATLFSVGITPRTLEPVENIAVYTGEPEMTMTTDKNGTLYIYLQGTGTASVNWGDGTQSQTYSLQPSTSTTCSHAYTDATPRTITITGENITHFYCSFNQLTALDVSKNTALTTLECDYNQLTALDVSKNVMMNYLNCENNQIKVLDVSKNTALKNLNLRDNLFDAAALNTTFGTLHSNPGTKYIDIAGNFGIFGCDQTIATSKGWTLDVPVYTGEPIMAMATAINGTVSFVLRGTGTATVNWGDGTSSQTYTIQPTTSTTCSHAYTDATTRIITITCDNVTYLSCYSNQITALDVSKNTALTTLLCYENQITALDVSKNTALSILSCYSNQITALDVSKNTALTDLRCYSNQITALDLSKNTALSILFCYSNQLTVVDVSKNTALTTLWCDNNQITALDVSKNTALTTLLCENNQITVLDVSKNTVLTTLWCGNNQITALDVSKNTALTRLYMQNNLFDTSALNATFGTLHSNPGTKTIYIAGNTGASTCTQTIATDKGWAVNTTTN